MRFEDFAEIPPYSLPQAEKERLLAERLTELTGFHREHCPAYARILDAYGADVEGAASCAELPFLPVRLFKELKLQSVPDDQIVRQMTSSGTTGQSVSRIYLDRATAANQQKAMAKIVTSFLGSDRLPMIIIDSPSVIKNRAMFSARGAGILGFSIFGTRRFHALDDEMKLDAEGLRAFLAEFGSGRILLFGFTFMVWQHFYRELVRLKEQEGMVFDLSRGILFHGGGWKKLVRDAVTPEEFRERLREVCGIRQVHDYYGMVEQTGCIHVECACGHLHTSVFSDVIIRRSIDFTECAVGEKGLLQVVSAIPESYPGHSLLTEDEGIVLGVDDCPCGRKGKYFKVVGRLKNAELRGCSDTYAAGF